MESGLNEILYFRMQSIYAPAPLSRLVLLSQLSRMSYNVLTSHPFPSPFNGWAEDWSDTLV